MYRQGVEQLVGQHQSVETLGQAVEPADARHQVRRAFGQRRLLAGAKFAREIEDGVALGQRRACFEFKEQIGGELARAGANLDDVRCAEGHDLRRLCGQRLGEERREFGRGDEVAGSAELVCAARVVAEAGGVQRAFHEARERQPAAGSVDFSGDQPAQCSAGSLGVGRGQGQGGHGVVRRQKGDCRTRSASHLPILPFGFAGAKNL